MSNFKDLIEKDIEDIFLNTEEFATDATLLCGNLKKNVKVIFGLDPELSFNNELATKAVFVLVNKNDINCEKPKIIIKNTTYNTIYKEDNNDNFYKIYLSKNSSKIY